MFRFLMALLALVFVALPGSVLSQSRGNVFEVEAKIIDSQGRLIGNPRFRALAGAEVVVAYHDVSGYGLRFTIDDESNQQSGIERVNIRSRLYIPNGPEWALVARPEARMAVGGTARIQQQNGFTVEFRALRQDLILGAAEIAPVTDCPLLQAFNDPEPLDGVRLVGLKTFKMSLQEGNEEGNGPIDSNCCRSGAMTCCGTPGHGVCCSDPSINASCCTPR